MTQQELLNEFLSLPTEAQRQVVDFIAFLRQRYAVIEPAAESLDFNLIDDILIDAGRGVIEAVNCLQNLKV